MRIRFTDHLNSKVLLQYPELRSLADSVGGTELYEVPRRKGEARILAKLESQNPYGSVKDRVAFAMLYQRFLNSEERGLGVLEYTGGSLGVSLAQMCRMLDLPLKLVIGTVPEALAKCELSGLCQLERVDPELGFWFVIQRALQLADGLPNYRLLYQHQNTANPWIHQTTTAREILAQSLHLGVPSLDAWVASIGTGGTLMGVYEGLSHTYPQIKLIAVSPDELPYGSMKKPNGIPKFAGSGGLGCGRKQPFVEPHDHRFHQHAQVTLADALKESEEFYSETGVKIGSSSGANLKVARKIAATLSQGKTVITIFPS
jgi:cysteine synthase A